MKKKLLFFALLAFCLTETVAQSLLLRPDRSYISSYNPHLTLTAPATAPPIVRGQRSQGTLPAPTVINAGQVMLNLIGAGYNGSYFYDQAAIRLSASSNWSDTLRGTKISFHTTPNNRSSMLERMVLSDQGYLGINQPNPGVPFHVNYTNSTLNSTTGTAIFGALTDRHLNFNSFGIDAYEGASSTELFLNSTSSGAVVVGGFFSPSDFDVTGYTRLGGDISAPKIKMKKLIGTTNATAGGVANIPHGIGSAAKILSIDIAVNASSSTFVPENYTQSTNLEFNYYYNDTNIDVVTKAGNSAAILGRPIKIIITYEE